MGLRVMSSRVWDSHTDWCSPRVGGGWDCPFEARKWPPVSQGLLSKAKLDLDSVLFHCGMEWGPGRGLSPKCHGSKAPGGCCLFSSKGPVCPALALAGKVESTYLHRKMEERNCFWASAHSTQAKQRKQMPTNSVFTLFLWHFLLSACMEIPYEIRLQSQSYALLNGSELSYLEHPTFWLLER